jgi:hypothetical protein
MRLTFEEWWASQGRKNLVNGYDQAQYAWNAATAQAESETRAAAERVKGLEEAGNGLCLLIENMHDLFGSNPAGEWMQTTRCYRDMKAILSPLPAQPADDLTGKGSLNIRKDSRNGTSDALYSAPPNRTRTEFVNNPEDAPKPAEPLVNRTGYGISKSQDKRLKAQGKPAEPEKLK